MQLAEFVTELEANFPGRIKEKQHAAFHRALRDVPGDVLEKLLDHLSDDKSYNPQYPPTPITCRRISKQIAGVSDFKSSSDTDHLRAEMFELTDLFWTEEKLDRIAWGNLIEKFYNVGRVCAGEHCQEQFTKFERILSGDEDLPAKHNAWLDWIGTRDA